MAEGFAKKYSKGQIIIQSGGTIPAKNVSRNAIAVMKERDIDISQQSPKQISKKMMNRVTHIISMGCDVQESCPVFIIKGEIVDWELDDPKGKPLDEFRKIRDLIDKKVLNLINSILDS
jgi:arsenate reductase (thioredoxin)